MNVFSVWTVAASISRPVIFYQCISRVTTCHTSRSSTCATAMHPHILTACGDPKPILMPRAQASPARRAPCTVGRRKLNVVIVAPAGKPLHRVVAGLAIFPRALLSIRRPHGSGCPPIGHFVGLGFRLIVSEAHVATLSPSVRSDPGAYMASFPLEPRILVSGTEGKKNEGIPSKAGAEAAPTVRSLCGGGPSCSL